MLNERSEQMATKESILSELGGQYGIMLGMNRLKHDDDYWATFMQDNTRGSSYDNIQQFQCFYDESINYPPEILEANFSGAAKEEFTAFSWT